MIRLLNYKQGQYDLVNDSIREYFYYIDHQGMLFLDDSRMKNFTSCFKDKQFLKFFFSRLRLNQTSKYQDEFKYCSPCGKEMNYVRCDDVPIVFTHIIQDGQHGDVLSYGHAGELLTAKFEPEKLYMTKSGRVYHPANEQTGGVGLVKSSLAIEFSKYFVFEIIDQSDMKSPIEFVWKGINYKLTKELRDKMK